MGEFIRNQLPDPIEYFEEEGLKLQGKGPWRTTSCSFHGGSDSMRINTVTGAWVCMACAVKGGDVLSHHMQAHDLDFIDAAKALGAWRDDGTQSLPQRPTPLSARAAIQVLSLECSLIAIAGGNLAGGFLLTEVDLARVFLAVQRVLTMSEAYR